MSNEKYPWWVHRGFARKDGRRPDEFDHWQWPVSDVRLAWPTTPDAEMPLRFHCSIASDVPRANQYDEHDQPVPDPVGMALSRIRFELRAVDDDEVLQEIATGQAGDVMAHGGHAGKALWSRLTPGSSLQVRLYAMPMFYWLSESGSVMAAYANMGHRGYFAGTECESRAYLLTLTEGMTPDDPTPKLLIDGQESPPAPEPPPEVLTPEEIELRAQMEREHQEAERQRREIAERERKQREEINAAKKLIYGRRGDYGSVEDWLFGVLHDKAVDFSIRKRVYRVAEEVGFDLEAAQKRRQEEREREAAEKKRRYEEEQARQAEKDNLEMIRGMFEMYFAETLDQKAALLRKAYAHPQFERYKPAIEIVAGELGVTL